MDETGEHSSEDRGGNGLHDIGACASAPHDWKQAENDGGHGHDFRAQPLSGPFFYGFE